MRSILVSTHPLTLVGAAVGLAALVVLGPLAIVLLAFLVASGVLALLMLTVAALFSRPAPAPARVSVAPYPGCQYEVLPAFDPAVEVELARRPLFAAERVCFDPLALHSDEPASALPRAERLRRAVALALSDGEPVRAAARLWRVSESSVRRAVHAARRSATQPTAQNGLG